MEDRIAVIGLGKAGLPLAAVIADSGLRVVGVDIDAEKCGIINSGKNPIGGEPGLDELISKHGGRNLLATPRFDDARECNVFIIIVPLFVDLNHNPNFKTLEIASGRVGNILKKGDLVVLETTVPPGTTETMIRPWLRKASGLSSDDFYLAYSPERIMTGYSISRLRDFPKVIGGADEESGKRALEVYGKFIKNIRSVSSARVAEFIKVIEGCYRDVNIALANELFKIAEALNIDFYEARGYANHQYCQIHMPSTGVGGHCIPVYPWFLIKEREESERFDDARLLRTARMLNDGMIDYWSEKIVLQALKIQKPLADVKICVKGVTFRPGVREIHHSRNLALVKILASKGLDVYVWDPVMGRNAVEGLGLRWLETADADIVFDPFTLRFEGDEETEKKEEKEQRALEGPACGCPL